MPLFNPIDIQNKQRPLVELLQRANPKAALFNTIGQLPQAIQQNQLARMQMGQMQAMNPLLLEEAKNKALESKAKADLETARAKGVLSGNLVPFIDPITGQPKLGPDNQPIFVPKESKEAKNLPIPNSEASYKFNDSRLESLGKPFEDASMRFGRLINTINQKTPTADALIAPELLTLAAGGQGSGLRMTEAEIGRVVGGRTNWEGLKAALNKWQVDPSKGLSITDAQRQQINDLVNSIGQDYQSKLDVINNARQSLIETNDIKQHKQIVSDARKKIFSDSFGNYSTVQTIPGQKSGNQQYAPTAMSGNKTQSVYSNPGQVKADLQSGKIDQSTALNILNTQFKNHPIFKSK